ncbi:hypothetical protein MMC28_001076 [Mycoblastus sanguinarius]|nr:hypothetical protein [Mycoblastus sanguinarius]
MDTDMGRIVIVSSWTHDPYHASSERHIRNKSHKTVSQDSKILAEAGEDDNKGGPIALLLAYSMLDEYFRTSYKSATDILENSFDEQAPWGEHPQALYFDGTAKADKEWRSRTRRREAIGGLEY